ncbi:MAG TPA: Do family serine endopeptidase [bacterium]|nr:Do family serine endopeptidase [bacterium]
MRKIAGILTVLLFCGTLAAAAIQDLEREITQISEKAQKSVAFIKVSKTMRGPGPGMDPFWDMLRDFGFRGNGPQFNPKQEGLGTGFVIDAAEGYLVTNNHVIDGADKLEVTINKKTFAAKVIGTDPKTDIGLIRLEKFAKGDIEQLPLADSDAVKVGSFAIAVGNPFGLSQSVSFGIVSATGRSNVNITEYEDFIQTDAAINPGNSGGPLLNIQGQVIGMNSAIFSKSGGYMGIGFAVPSNMIKSITDQLRGGKKIKRALMGVNIQDLTPELAKHLGMREDQAGVLISSVAKGSPAEKAGMKKGDVVTLFDGKPVESSAQLRNLVAFSPFNKKIALTVVRDGKQLTLMLSLSEKFEFEGAGDGEGVSNDFGFGVMEQNGKVVVQQVDPQSLAAMAGLREGDIVEEVNKKPVRNLREFNAAAGAAKSLLLLIERKGREFFVVINR